MKICIIGGGPAGLYFASYLKSQDTTQDITVYEAQNESINAFGLGYTLQELDCILLSRLDQNYRSNLFFENETPLITQALFKTNFDSTIRPFSEGFSVSRTCLLSYLRDKALSLNIKFISQKIVITDLEKLQKKYDLVVVADGIHSIARTKFRKQLGAQEHTAKLKFSWFTNLSHEPIHDARFYAYNTESGVILMTSYPLTHHKQVVIIEMTDACLAEGPLKNKLPNESVPFLNELLNINGDAFDLQSANLPWYTFKMNSAEHLCHQNLVLIGDAGYSFHYSAGQGVTTSFSMAYTLSQCLLKNDQTNIGLAHYNHSIRLLLAEPAKKSQRHMNWFEGIDHHFKNTTSDEWLELFLKKDEFKQVNSKQIKCNTSTCR